VAPASCGRPLVTPVAALGRKFVAIAAASSLAWASPAKIASLGMVMHSERAHVGEAAASAGSTIFEGDQLSTEAGGLLRIAIPALTLQLGGQSALVLGHAVDPEGIVAELASGTLVFSAAPSGHIVIAANEALVRPSANVATVAHVRVVSPRELRIYPQRGALEFSYRGESETIQEGKIYRVILDPSETESAALGSDHNTKPSATHHPTFILVAIAAAVGVAIAIPMIMHADESPDRPGSRPPKKP
jgi:hypothetical protein